MQADAARITKRFDSAVLTWVGDDGYPFSIRCHPSWESRNEARLELPLGFDRAEGRASLLYHSHDHQLWKLRMLLAIGERRKANGIHRFKLIRIRTGVAGVTKFHWLQALIKSRRRTSRYLQDRAMSRPSIDWERIKQLKREA
jgi:hypothetical protein